MTDWRPTQSPNPAPRRIGPMTLADIVDSSFRLFKTNWKDIAKIVLILSIPVMIVNMALYAIGGSQVSDIFTLDPEASAQNEDLLGGDTVAFVALTIVLYIVTFVMSVLMTAVIARIVAASYLGRKITGGEALRGLLKKWPTLIGASLLVALAVVGVWFVFSIPAFLLAIIAIPLLFLTVFALLPAAVMGTLISLYVPVIAVEEAGAIRSVNRSWSLVRPRFWPYLGTMILVWIVAAVVSGIAGSVLLLIRAVVEAVFEPAAYLLIAFEAFASNVISTPLIAAGLTLIYFDSRIRHEGFDLEYSAADDASAPPANQ